MEFAVRGVALESAVWPTCVLARRRIAASGAEKSAPTVCTAEKTQSPTSCNGGYSKYMREYANNRGLD